MAGWACIPRGCHRERVEQARGRRDAHLLEGVGVEELEAVHVEQPDVPLGLRLVLGGLVHAVHHEAEEARVHDLDHRVAR